MFPTSIQVLLVRALLASDEEFSLSWNAWKSLAGPYEKLDPGSLRLFPLAYRRLLRLLPEDSLYTVCRNAYRTSWLKNSLLFNEAGKVMDLLTEHDIPYLLLKGGAFIPLYYDNDIGVRSLDDIDILIPVQHFSHAIVLLCERYPEYSTHTDVRLFQPEFFHEMSVYTPFGILDIHCHVLHSYLYDDDWLILSKDVQVIKLQSREVMTLSHTSHLVHICAHAMGWNGTDEIQLKWIIDAVLIIQSGNIDWQSVVDLAQRMNVTVSVGSALCYLHDQSFASIPRWVIEKFDTSASTLSDRRMAYLESQDTYTHIVPAIELYWWRYIRSLARPYGFKNAMRQAVKFLKFLCQTPSLIAIPGIVMLRFYQLVGRFLKRMLAINFLF